MTEYTYFNTQLLTDDVNHIIDSALQPPNTDTISANNATDAHGQDSVTYDKLLLHGLKTSEQCIHSLHATQNA
jgi:hypothetical protein